MVQKRPIVNMFEAYTMLYICTYVGVYLNYVAQFKKIFSFHVKIPVNQFTYVLLVLSIQVYISKCSKQKNEILLIHWATSAAVSYFYCFLRIDIHMYVQCTHHYIVFILSALCVQNPNDLIIFVFVIQVVLLPFARIT